MDNATLALDPAWSGQIRFQAETPANVRAEHLSKITLGGQPVVENTQVTLTPVGSTGCTLTRAHFAGMLKMIDDSVGAILQQLETHGLADHTIVIFASDNGGQLQSVWGSAPSEWFDANGILRGGKQESYEGGLRVPMIVRWPGKTPAGGTSDHPLYFADFMPTFCELLGTPPPSYTDGISFLPTLEGRPQDQRPHAFLYWCHQWSSLDHAVRSGKWKAVKRGNNPLELYDLESDLRETTNVAAANPDR